MKQKEGFASGRGKPFFLVGAPQAGGAQRYAVSGCAAPVKEPLAGGRRQQSDATPVKLLSPEDTTRICSELRRDPVRRRSIP